MDALRTVILGVSTFGLPFDFAVLIGFALVMVAIGTWSFKKMKI